MIVMAAENYVETETARLAYWARCAAHSIVRCRERASDKTLSYFSRCEWDKLAAASEARVIDYANRTIRIMESRK